MPTPSDHTSGQARITPGGRAEIGLLNAGLARLIGLAAGGQPPHVFTTLARNRGLFRRWLWFAGGLMPGGKLPRRDTELVILRVAHNTGCDYERGHHEELGRRAGLAAAEVERVGEGPDAPGWTPRQALLLRAADQLHATGDIGDELWSALAAELDEPRLIELCLLIGHYEMLAMTLNALRVQPDPEPIGRRLPRWRSRA
ncbi:MAG TPA: carboxymuconolactone decarboxylase family protein [Solirubrobacterales bacterium]|nr:carboxymuconolactone decarboxylase family protein [Solirubrobacterales bacterium]